MRAAIGRSSSPHAKRWARRPSAPKRASTDVGGKAAKVPNVRMPNRCRRSDRSGRSSTSTENEERKEGV